MTKEEIIKEALKAEKEQFPRCTGDRKNSFHGVNSAYGIGFVDGALWACDYKESLWISVKDGLPCNHEELISPDDKRDTLYVVAVIRGNIIFSRMRKLEGKWFLENDEHTHWFPIPKSPK